jgi:hypothetical protein
VAGFVSEWVAGFILECMAGFVGIRTSEVTVGVTFGALNQIDKRRVIHTPILPPA